LTPERFANPFADRLRFGNGCNIRVTAILAISIFISSAGAFTAMTGELIHVFAKLASDKAGYSPYTPTKAAIRSLADTLRQGGLMYGFKSYTVYRQKIISPGFAETIATKPQITTDLEAADNGQTPRVLALRVISELEHGRFTINAGFIARLLSTAMLGPSPFESISDLPLGFIALLAWPFVRRDQDAKFVKAGHYLEAQCTS
jgi:NAD(P)-dependent dehydrogenase (short-subunit alcohol dehydrogenase family)